MKKFSLPHTPVKNPDYTTQQHGDVLLIDTFPISDGEQVRLIFESSNSPWRQGVWLGIDNYMVINNQRCKSAVLWIDSAPKQIDIICHTSNKSLLIYNVWDSGRGMSMESQASSSGMVVQEIESGKRYKCNDIGFGSKFDKIVFSVIKM